MAWIAFLPSPDPALQQNHQTISRPFCFVFELFPPISELIHLARCIEFNPQFIPWLVLIALRGTQLNWRINFSRGLGRLNRGLALIGFRTTGACRVQFGIDCTALVQSESSNFVECTIMNATNPIKLKLRWVNTVLRVKIAQLWTFFCKMLDFFPFSNYCLLHYTTIIADVSKIQVLKITKISNRVLKVAGDRILIGVYLCKESARSQATKTDNMRNIYENV